MSDAGHRAQGDPTVGLCSTCREAAVQGGARGSRFWRCRRADSDPAFLRYPPLPVQRCTGYEEGAPHERGGSRER